MSAPGSRPGCASPLERQRLTQKSGSVAGCVVTLGEGPHPVTTNPATEPKKPPQVTLVWLFRGEPAGWCRAREGFRAPGGELPYPGGFSSLPGRVSGFLKERCRMKEDCRRIVRSTLLDAETLLHEPENPPARTASPRKSRTHVTLLGLPRPTRLAAGCRIVSSRRPRTPIVNSRTGSPGPCPAS